MIYGTVGCLGDSLLAGARADHDAHAGLGAPEWLVPILDLATPAAPGVEPMEWAALSRSISGQTTRQILDRAPAVVREVAGYAGAKWLVVLAGTNDSKACPPLAEWEALYRQILHFARRANVPIAVCTFPPVVPAAMPCYTRASVEWLQAASQRVREIAAELDGRPVPVVVVELEDLPSSLLVDGVHFTPDGHREVAVRIAAALTGAPVEAVRALAPEVPAGRYASLAPRVETKVRRERQPRKVAPDPLLDEPIPVQPAVRRRREKA
jgi:lysophospholipase L1-like esterase